MIFLAVLTVATAAAAIFLSGRRSARDIARIGMATAMAVAGVAHWVAPAPFLQHLPPWVPWAEALILLTGFVEVGLGAALLVGRVRRYAGLALAGHLVLVFPANVYVAVAGVDVDGQPGGWYPWLRLPLQLVFVMWAWWSTRPDAGIDQTVAPTPRRVPGLT